MQLCPPKESAKTAEPLVAGVPENVNSKESFPVANVPLDNVAVKPVTPVDEIL